VKSRGIVRVLKGGWLEGNVHAPSLVVEKGGVFVGDCHIQPLQPAVPAEESEEPSAEPTES
jgi:cytoskeletal protein CcmA (bactofilin family)